MGLNWIKITIKLISLVLSLKITRNESASISKSSQKFRKSELKQREILFQQLQRVISKIT